MKKGFSYSVTIEPQDKSKNLENLSRRWDSNFDIKVTDLSQFSKGPVIFVSPEVFPTKIHQVFLKPISPPNS